MGKRRNEVGEHDFANQAVKTSLGKLGGSK